MSTWVKSNRMLLSHPQNLNKPDMLDGYFNPKMFKLVLPNIAYNTLLLSATVLL